MHCIGIHNKWHSALQRVTFDVRRKTRSVQRPSQNVQGTCSLDCTGLCTKLSQSALCTRGAPCALLATGESLGGGVSFGAVVEVQGLGQWWRCHGGSGGRSSSSFWGRQVRVPAQGTNESPSNVTTPSVSLGQYCIFRVF